MLKHSAKHPSPVFAPLPPPHHVGTEPRASPLSYILSLFLWTRVSLTSLCYPSGAPSTRPAASITVPSSSCPVPLAAVLHNSSRWLQTYYSVVLVLNKGETLLNTWTVSKRSGVRRRSILPSQPLCTGCPRARRRCARCPAPPGWNMPAPPAPLSFSGPPLVQHEILPVHWAQGRQRDPKTNRIRPVITNGMTAVFTSDTLFTEILCFVGMITGLSLLHPLSHYTD